MGSILDKCDEIQKEMENKSVNGICYLCDKSFKDAITTYYNFCTVHYNCYCEDKKPKNILLSKKDLIEVMKQFNEVICKVNDGYLWRELAGIESRLLEISLLTPNDILDK